MRNLRKNDGFTLIELMIVVVIIGILAAIAIPKFTAVSNGAKQAEAEPILKQICSLAETYELKEGTAADDIADLTSFVDPSAKYFETWDFDGTNATAALKAAGAGLQVPTMNCDTKVISLAAPA